MSSALRIVLSTCPADAAERLARWLVAENLAACVNIVRELHSVYRWQDEIVSEPEQLLVIKTSQAREAELFRRLADEHPYDVPEILSLAPDQVLPDYLTWALAATTPDA